MIHTGEKPFHCDGCDSKHNRKDKLNQHKNVKHNENDEKMGYACHICLKAYGSNWYLNKHMEKVHSSELI